MNNLKIEVLSPVHIGDSDTKILSSLSDFIKEDDNIKLLDHKKLENIFAENPQFMEDYIKEVKVHSGKSYSLDQFLRKYKIGSEEVTSAEMIPVIGDFNAKEIHPFISSNGKKYIPGSTIKGAIRNSLAYIYLKEHQDMIQKINQRNFEPKSKPNFNFEDKNIFGKDPFNDILKYLQVYDSRPFPENTYAVYSSRNYHLKKQKIEQTIPLNYECILPDSESVINLKIKDNIPLDMMKIEDKNFWKNNLTLDKIFSALNSLSIRFIERERGELSGVKEMQPTIIFYNNLLNSIKNSDNKSAFLCIGKGTTIMEKTILLAFSNKELHSLRNKMKDTKTAQNFGWKFVDGKGMLPPKLPVTRLVYKNQNNWQAGFGWIKMEEI